MHKIASLFRFGQFALRIAAPEGPFSSTDNRCTPQSRTFNFRFTKTLKIITEQWKKQLQNLKFSVFSNEITNHTQKGNKGNGLF